MQSAIIASLAASAVAAPFVARRQATAAPPGGDATILNYALSLEHLEATFYREALQKFTLEDFQAAGLGADFLDNLKEIAKDEATHVDFLTTGLSKAGATPAQECKYDFGYKDVQGFLATANLLEGVGISAYLGAANVIANKDYLTAAGAILTVEARHSAFLRGNQEPKPYSPFPAPFDIPLDFNQVFSLAAPLITSCPDGTKGTLGLPFKAYPSIAVTPAAVAKPGDVLTFTVKEAVAAKKAYFITYPGGAIEAEITSTSETVYTVTVPAAAQPGQAYVVLTSGDAPTDDNTVAGPAVFEILDNAGEFQAENPGYSYSKDCEEKKGYGSGSKPAPYSSAPAPAPYSPKAPEYSPAPAPSSTPVYYAPEYSSTSTVEYKPAPTYYKAETTSTVEYKAAPTYPAEYPTTTTVVYAPKYTSTSTATEYKPSATPYAYPPVYDKEGHAYPLDKEGHVCVYDKSTGKPYEDDKNGKPYYYDSSEKTYYTVDYQGKKEACDESYKPY
ncbi:hypothetical protein DOTSEDRAFT_72090 [Dothistroma septosporum NZE10]|uniref:Uncharacterized protein n=1 Tax=Dothistroma septosporum (strain NZE10 / CBS 128990) TaxID=675120 RepID=N1PNK1_DOTSN|nr:hypothetical protein DOTSEDRAFT_72090 [Dothistroma septosporum NZE10]